MSMGLLHQLLKDIFLGPKNYPSSFYSFLQVGHVHICAKEGIHEVAAARAEDTTRWISSLWTTLRYLGVGEQGHF